MAAPRNINTGNYFIEMTSAVLPTVHCLDCLSVLVHLHIYDVII